MAQTFMDYRGNVQGSPVVWCIYCKNLQCKDGQTYVMTTAYHATEHGIYPCGICAEHQQKEKPRRNGPICHSYVPPTAQGDGIPRRS